MRNILQFKILIVWIVALLTTSCQQQYRQPPHIPSDSAYFPQKPLPTARKQGLRIGLFLPLTGPHKDIGENLLNAFEMGFFKHAPDHIKLFPLDTQSTTAGAAQALAQAQTLRIDMAIGPLTADQTRTIQSSAQWPILSLSNDQTVSSQNTWPLGLSSDAQVHFLLKILQERNIKRIAFLAPEGPLGDKIAAQLKTQAHLECFTWRYAAQAIECDRVTIQIPDLRKKGLSDIVIADNLHNAALMKKKFSFSPQDRLYILDHWRHAGSTFSSHDLNGAEIIGVCLDNYNTFAQAYEKNYGVKPHPISGLAYDAIRLCTTLPQTESILEKIKAPQGFLGVYGPFRFQTNGQVQRKVALYKWADEKVTLSIPASSSFTN